MSFKWEQPMQELAKARDELTNTPEDIRLKKSMLLDDIDFYDYIVNRRKDTSDEERLAAQKEMQVLLSELEQLNS